MRIVDVQIASRAYPIFIGPGARNQITSVLQRNLGTSQVAIIADSGVAEHLPALREALGGDPLILSFPSGEGSKSLAEAGRLYDALAEARIGRRDVIVTFGGGVAGDLGGFVAATWQRGVRYVQIPTTLEAAIDASVGGKTAINHGSGKNLVGAFHQPIAVIVDTDFLATLPARDFSAGLAESVKHAVVRDPNFLTWQEQNATAILARDPAACIELIARNCTIKAQVVARDEREDNLRAVLNHGHTLGHAIEHLLGYELRHGECVGLGMLAENDIAVGRGILPRGVAERIEVLLQRCGLPTRLPRPLESDKVLAASRMDKKNRGSAIFAVLISGLGQPALVGDISEAEITRGLGKISPNGTR